MGDKKRKSIDSAPEVPKKKSKKSDAPATSLTATSAPNPEQGAAAVAKKTRKRAADFMSDEEAAKQPAVAQAETDVPPKASKKSKKSSKNEANAAMLTADGANGVVEHTDNVDVETTTKAIKKKSSMQQEAQDTVDKEIEEEFASFSNEDDKVVANEQSDDEDDDDTGAGLLTGFDSDSADEAQDEGDLSKTPALPNYKKTSKKLRQAKEKGGQDEPGTVYVGRIPHGFYETEMRAFFSQFGDITRLRLSRNKQTGASKHFAFIEFASTEVAKIVAEAMDNYLMFGHILKCKFAPIENLHPDTFKGANKKYRKIPHAKLEGAKLAEPKSVEQWQKKNQKEKKRRNKKAKLLKETMGYEAPNGALADPANMSKQKQLETEDAVKSLDAAADRQLRVENGDTPAVKKTVADKVKQDVAPSPVPAKKDPKVEEEATTAAASEDKKGKKAKREKYAPPTHKKQAEKAKFAKEHPEGVKEAKREKETERLQKRAEKKAKKVKY